MIIKYFDKLVVYLLYFLNKIHFHIINKYNIKKSHFKYMIPEKNGKNTKVYEAQLLEALDNEDVKNIAVTGDYGAGKSSFLKTFEHKYKDCKFLDISLATFENTKDSISVIEKGILEQIFYKESHKKIPQSRFKKIKSYKWILAKTIIGMLSILSILFLLKPKLLIELEIYKKLIEKVDLIYIESFNIGFLVIGVFFTIRYFIKNFNGFSLNKFNLQSIEIESTTENPESLLNKYIDEILYFFEKTDYKVVVFQDLDRFDNSKIFVKLRELNNFINQSKQVNKRVVFIYVLKDEIFKDQNERVKFFDCIIPIIPHINAKTSYDTLYEWFKNEVDIDFLKNISIYIYDMRLLKNIYNEYKIFKLQIGKGIDRTKLLAIIIYKNFYPNDYSKLHKGQSLINKIIKEKHNYIFNITKQYDDKIKNLNSKLESLREHNSIIHLRATYIYEIVKTLKITNSYFYCDNQMINLVTAVDNGFFNRIKNSKELKKDNNYHTSSILFKDIELKINPDLTYQEREDLILSEKGNKIKDLEKEIENLQEKIQDLIKSSLKDILQKVNLKEIIDTIESKENENKKINKDLLEYLLLSGCIDENYYMYISFDMKNSLSQNDITFLKAVKTNKALEFNFELNNINEIIENLNIDDFYKVSILNINLVDYLISSNLKDDKQKEFIFKFLSNNDNNINKFIAYCIDYIPNRVEFVKHIVKNNSNTWNIIKEFGTKKSLDSYCGWIFHYANYEDIRKLKDFKYYFENKTFIQSFSGDEAKKVIKYIKEFNIKFSKLNEISSSQEIKRYIFENNHYVISEHMINFMIYNFCAPKSEIESNLTISHFTTIKSNLQKEQEKVISYIEDNLNEYINNVFLQIETNTKESEEIIIELLNSDKLDISIKEKIIAKEEAIINDIQDIKNDTWKLVLKHNKIEANWNNVSYYFIDNEQEIDSELFKFLNNIDNAKKLSQTRISKKYCEDNENFDTNILYQIIIDNDFTLESYKLLVKSNGYWYEEIDISELDIEKINILLEYGKFQLTNSNLQSLKEVDKHNLLIEKNFDYFIEEFDALSKEIELEDYKQILNNKKISDEQKIELINMLNVDIIDEELSKQIVNIFISNKIIIDDDLKFKIFKVLEEKLKYLIQYLEIDKDLDCKTIDLILNNFKEPYSQLCKISNDRLDLKASTENKQLLKILKNKGCISSFPKVKNNFQVYRKRVEKDN